VPRLFTAPQIAAATLFGTPLAGAWLAANNLAALGRPRGRALFVAVFALVAAEDLVLALLDAPDWAAFAIAPVDVVAAWWLARRAFADATTTARRRSTREVAQRVIGAALVYTAVVGGAWLGIVSFGPPSWKSALQDAVYVGADEAVRFADEATRDDAARVARVLVDEGALTGRGSFDATIARFGDDVSLTITTADENARFRVDRAAPRIAAALSTCVHLQERTKDRVRRTAKACP
jgi:hypothetical protein